MRFTKFMAGVLAATMIIPVIGSKASAYTAAVSLTYFRDEAFKEYIKSNFDINNDNYLDANELSNIKEININGYTEIKSLAGIEKLTDLTKLKIRNTSNLERLSFDNPTKITYIDAEKSGISYIDTKNCPELTHLDLYAATKLQNIGIATNSKLTYFDISETKVKEVNILYNSSLLNTYKTLTPVTKTWIDTPAYCYGDYKDTAKDTYLSFNTDTKVYTECPDGYIDYYNSMSKPLADALMSKDSKNTGLISLSEIMNMTELSVEYLESVDEITQFKNLKSLRLYHFMGNSFDTKLFPNLHTLTISCHEEQKFDSIDFSALSDLYELYLNKVVMENVDLSKNTNLQTLSITQNSALTNIDINSNTKLFGLRLHENNALTTLDFSNNANLKAIICGKNANLSSIELPSALSQLTVQDSPKLTSIDITKCTELWGFDIEGTGISDVDLSKCPKLQYCDVFDTPITELDISYCPELINFHDNGPVIGIFDSYQYYGYEPGDGIGIYINPSAVIYTVKGTRPTPTPKPTSAPGAPTTAPSKTPSSAPTSAPNGKPTVAPTTKPGVTTSPSTTTVPGTTTAPSATTTPSKPGATTTAPSKPTATPTPKPSKPQTGVSDKSGTVEDFAERLYTTCLGRDAEQAGKDYWVGELKAGKPGSEVARGFFFSPEFTGLNLSNEEYITRLYRTFMGREPDKDGMNYWLGEMKNGQGRVFVFDGFVNSPEWADICLTYGIRSGGLAEPTFEKQASKKVLAFAERLYTTCLGRDAEPEGLKYWSQELANLRQTGTVAASGFFNSPEFINLNTSNEEYITRLYRTFMGREPEKAGFDYWMSELKAGKDRQSVFDGFSVAPEFANLCAEAGIMR